MNEYKFTNDWFGFVRKQWDDLIPLINPKKILEIGSYEGNSTCYLIEKLSSPLEIHCIDTWQGGIEHNVNMKEIENNFLYNISLAIEKSKDPNNINLIIHKGFSDIELCKLLLNKSSYFDLIYIDGSHQAPDVLYDAILSFKLLKIGGVIIFDDYLWNENLPYGIDPLRCPKIAIDSFTNIFSRKINILQMPLYQMYIRKIFE